MNLSAKNLIKKCRGCGVNIQGGPHHTLCHKCWLKMNGVKTIKVDSTHSKRHLLGIINNLKNNIKLLQFEKSKNEYEKEIITLTAKIENQRIDILELKTKIENQRIEIKGYYELILTSEKKI